MATNSTIVEDRRSGIDPAVGKNLMLQLLPVNTKFQKLSLS